ncbi:MAG: response regulator [Chthoniobacter sp.]
MVDRAQLQVLVVDENPLTRFGVLSIANLHPLLHVCDEAADARAARELYSRENPAVVLLDVTLPHGDGIELVEEFSQLQPDCRFIVVSELCDHATIERAFHAGAHGYVSKKDQAAEVLCALEAVITGGTYMSKLVTECLRATMSRKLPNRALAYIRDLSNRELHIFRRIGKGQGTTAIARELGVSVKTIETHQGRMKAKLRLMTIAQLRIAAASWLAFSLIA